MGGALRRVGCGDARSAPHGLTAGACGLWIAAFVALSLAHDVAYGYRPQADSLIYLRRAAEFAAGDFTSAATNWSLAPGYSAFLAPFHLLTPAPPWPLLVSAGAAAAAAGYLFLVRTLSALGVLDRRGTLVAVAAVVLNPLCWATGGQLLSEVLVIGLLATALALLLPATTSPARALALAASAGALVVTRFEYLAVVALLCAAALAARRRRGVLPASALAVGVLVALLGNAARNRAAFGEANPFSYGGGTVLYGGVNVAGTGSWHAATCEPERYRTYLPEAFHERYAALCRSFGSAPASYRDMDALFREMARARWSGATGEVLASLPVKVGKLWLVPGFFDLYTGDPGFRRGLQLSQYFSPERWPWHGVAKHAFYFALHWAALALVALGGWRLWSAGGTCRTWVAASGAAALSLTLVYGVALYGLPRFHDPLLAVLLAWAGGVGGAGPGRAEARAPAPS